MPEDTARAADRRFDPSMFDAYSPAQIAKRIEVGGVAKAHMETVPILGLAVLAGAFIAFGAMFYSAVVTDTAMGFGPSRLLGGLAFFLGPVTLGNIVGGGVFVALGYYVIYLRGKE